LCLAVDTERYSSRSDPGQEQVQRVLADVLAAAYLAAGLEGRVVRQPNGDGEVSLLDPELDEVDAAARFVDALSAALTAVPARVRLRLALHLGRADVGAQGFVGQAVVKVCRLLDAAPGRAALAGHPDRNLVVVLSEQLHDELRAAADPRLPAESFERVRVEAKNFAADAWLALAGGPAAPLPQPRPRATFSIEVHPGASVGTVIQAGDITGGLHL
jgi:hypothetical protein